MLHQGSCHCGAIAFEFEGEIGEVLSCNCSICRRKGSLLTFVPRDKLRLTTPESAMSTYTFNNHRIEHKFCATCGVAPLAFANAPDGSPMAAINVRCVPAVDLGTLKVREYDGASV
ncbi:GFA family protein [Pseudomonas citronellolis]|uniref:GFA family protein n=1 Tax=Pseudomonas citronellolis TaxID=53408 RepID=UPI0023E40F40|nr:GFA family protein [Pseudomonas citronellolis]MDF3936234.1 GFA family protein [Pseudomonas citronellolis]